MPTYIVSYKVYEYNEFLNVNSAYKEKPKNLKFEFEAWNEEEAIKMTGDFNNELRKKFEITPKITLEKLINKKTKKIIKVKNSGCRNYDGSFDYLLERKGMYTC